MSEENQNNESAMVDPIQFPTDDTQQKKETGSIELSHLNENVLSVSPALIINALKCIDAAANRGAYQGGELSTVGGVRDQLYSFVSTIVEDIAKKEAASQR